MNTPIELKTHRAGFGDKLIVGFHFERDGQLVNLEEVLREGFTMKPDDAAYFIPLLGHATKASHEACVKLGLPMSTVPAVKDRDSFAA